MKLKGVLQKRTLEKVIEKVPHALLINVGIYVEEWSKKDYWPVNQHTTGETHKFQLQTPEDI